MPFEFCSCPHEPGYGVREAAVAHQLGLQVSSCCYGLCRCPVSLHCGPLGRHFKDHHCQLTQSMHRASSVPTTMPKLSLHLWNVWPCTENCRSACDLRSWLYDITPGLVFCYRTLPDNVLVSGINILELTPSFQTFRVDSGLSHSTQTLQFSPFLRIIQLCEVGGKLGY